MPTASRPYAWPASKIDRDVMYELKLTSLATGKKITELVAEAVHAACNARFEEAARQHQPEPIGFATDATAAPPATGASAA